MILSTISALGVMAIWLAPAKALTHQPLAGDIIRYLIRQPLLAGSDQAVRLKEAGFHTTPPTSPQLAHLPLPKPLGGSDL